MSAWRWSAIGAIASIVIVLSFGFVPGINACGPATGAGQWANFQNITSVAHVRANIGPECPDAFVGALRSSMWLDAVVFIPAYALFLAALAYAAQVSRWPLRLTLGLLGGGVIADQLEGFALLAILNGLPGTEADVGNVVAAHVAKKIMLSLATAGIAVAVFQMAGWRRWAGGIAILGGFTALISTLTGYTPGEMGSLISWLVLAAVSVSGAFAERRSRAAQQ